MNKKQLIKSLKAAGGHDSKDSEDSWVAGYNEAIGVAISYAQTLEEEEAIEIPKWFEIWIVKMSNEASKGETVQKLFWALDTNQLTKDQQEWVRENMTDAVKSIIGTYKVKKYYTEIKVNDNIFYKNFEDEQALLDLLKEFNKK